MKKLHLIIVVLLYGINAVGQQTTPSEEIMTFTLPQGTQKLNAQQLKNLSQRGFDQETATEFQDHAYRKDNILMYYKNLWAFPNHPEYRHSLESNQKMVVSLLGELKDNVVDSSKIVIINNIRFALINYHINDNIRVRFTSDYDKNGGYINGFIEYKKSDEAEGKQYLQELLQSMHYKNKP